MAKRYQKQRLRDERQSKEIRTFDPEEFFLTAQRVWEATKNLNFLVQKADQSFPDDPTELIFQVLHDRYSNLWDIVSAYSRLLALFRLIRQHDFSQFVKSTEKGLQVAGELFYAAATAPIDAEGNFLLEPFRVRLAYWVQEHAESAPEAEPAGDGKAEGRK
jgi:hypothetical protein